MQSFFQALIDAETQFDRRQCNHDVAAVNKINRHANKSLIIKYCWLPTCEDQNGVSCRENVPGLASWLALSIPSMASTHSWFSCQESYTCVRPKDGCVIMSSDQDDTKLDANRSQMREKMALSPIDNVGRKIMPDDVWKQFNQFSSLLALSSVYHSGLHAMFSVLSRDQCSHKPHNWPTSD